LEISMRVPIRVKAEHKVRSHSGRI
jgi:hypothetical protein